MYFQVTCPGCQKSLKIREENAGNKVRCPYCHAAFTVKTPQRAKTQSGGGDDADDWAADARDNSGDWSASGSDDNMLQTALFALVGTGVFYLIVYPFSDFLGYFSDLFVKRGWVPIVLVFLLSWSIAILIMKSRRLTRQKDSMLFDLLPMEIADEISSKTAGKFAKHIRSLPANAHESFLINRVLRGLEHFRVLRSNSEVAIRLSSQSDIDATAVESSYTTLKVFIWAIPILGFIGTVMGISDSVAGFSSTASASTDMAVLKESLNGITGGLAMAFDTTLIALVMSLLVMFPTSSMQKSEEDLLNWVDEYCNENLLKRLKDGERGFTGPTNESARAIQRAIDAAMADHHAELRTWTMKLESIGGTLTQEVVQGWGEINEQLKSKQQGHSEQFEQVVSKVVQRQGDMLDKLEGVREQMANVHADHGEQFKSLLHEANEESQKIQQRAQDRQDNIEDDMAKLVDRFEKTLAGLAEQSESVQSQVASSMQATAENMGDYFGGLNEGLASLNGVLEGLDQKQVVIETRNQPQAEPSRGWGLFRRKNGVR